eukprot:663717-Alexandrium_andersonii.AAC.1
MVVGAHRLLLRKIGSGGWYFARMHHPDSAVLAVPAKRATLPGTQTTYWEVDLDAVQQPSYLAVWDLADWEAVHYQWHCPQWQIDSSARAVGLKPALRAFAAEGPGPLLKVLAKEGFFDISATVLKK